MKPQIGRSLLRSKIVPPCNAELNNTLPYREVCRFRERYAITNRKSPLFIGLGFKARLTNSPFSFCVFSHRWLGVWMFGSVALGQLVNRHLAHDSWTDRLRCELGALPLRRNVGQDSGWKAVSQSVSQSVIRRAARGQVRVGTLCDARHVDSVQA